MNPKEEQLRRKRARLMVASSTLRDWDGKTKISQEEREVYKKIEQEIELISNQIDAIKDIKSKLR